MVVSRNQSLDFFKGLMILFVIIGHVIPGSLDDNLFRYLIYVFHMPMFMFLSGFVAAKYNTKSKKIYFLGIIFKIIIPWIFAIIIYTLIQNNQISFNNKTLINSFLYPFYHLWYIPTYLLFTIVFDVFQYLKIQNLIYLILFSFFVFVFCTIYEPDYVSERNFLYTFRLKYFFYYAVGIYAFENFNEKLIDKCKFSLQSSGVLFLLIIFFYFENFSNKLTIEATKLLLNISLIFIMTIFIKYKSIQNQFLNLFGRETYSIYLWHIIPILFLRSIFQNQYFYYFSMLIVVLFVYIYFAYKHKLWKFQK